MPEHLIGDLGEGLFRTMDGLEADTISHETAAQITDVARAIIDSTKVEINLSGSLVPREAALCRWWAK